ncbi:hypothetical protein ElyMa_002229200 [Elysia marginata]|uniref:Uncharacterized protein n=1 Tax=Elysia marginata TaxID=1093978 RepID=A0AAV4FUY9_9GAST|nr:hypothetical protein ElyMa_002229200 [Elysia marginata]
MWNRRLLTNVVKLSHSRFLDFHNFILPLVPVAICVFFLSVCVAAEVSIGDDNDDSGDYYYDDFATYVDDDEDDDKMKAVITWMQEKHMILAGDELNIFY